MHCFKIIFNCSKIISKKKKKEKKKRSKQISSGASSGVSPGSRVGRGVIAISSSGSVLDFRLVSSRFFKSR